MLIGPWCLDRIFRVQDKIRQEDQTIYFTQLRLHVIQTDKEKETNKYNWPLQKIP